MALLKAVQAEQKPSPVNRSEADATTAGGMKSGCIGNRFEWRPLHMRKPKG